jgi:hypothetical protein
MYPQVIVLLLQFSVHHGLGQDEDMRMKDLSGQGIALDV